MRGVPENWQKMEREVSLMSLKRTDWHLRWKSKMLLTDVEWGDSVAKAA